MTGRRGMYTKSRNLERLSLDSAYHTSPHFNLIPYLKNTSGSKATVSGGIMQIEITSWWNGSQWDFVHLVDENTNFLLRWRMKVHTEERKRRTLMDIFCVSLIVFYSLLSVRIDGPVLAPSTGSLSLGLWLVYLVGRPTRRLERRGVWWGIYFSGFLHTGCLKLPVSCKWGLLLLAIEPFPLGFQSPCLHPLHPFKLGRRSSSTVTALGCFTISWIPPSPAHAFINSPFIQTSELS